jgi:para-aminobenzoate synthetase component 1
MNKSVSSNIITAHAEPPTPSKNCVTGNDAARGWYQKKVNLTDEQVKQIIKTNKYSVYLDSGSDLNKGKYNILTAAPIEVLNIGKLDQSQTLQGVKAFTETTPTLHPPSSFCRLPFITGLMGFCSYEFGASQIISTNHKLSHSNTPSIYIAYYTWSYVFDHEQQQGHLTFSPLCTQKTRDNILKYITDIPYSENLGDQYKPTKYQNTSTKSPDTTPTTQESWSKTINYATYLKQFSRIKRYIEDGDCYQVNFTQRFQKSSQSDPVDLYFETREKTNTPYSCYFSFGRESNLLCFSPEQFIGINNRLIETRPIKGTIENNSNQINAELLMKSDKNKAENLMIVDLLRNDLSKVCELNSIKVQNLFKLESYNNVHHLVSHITGQLKADISETDAFFSCFPGGSITGAPKKRSMEIINELEDSGRDAYCGSVFYLSDEGRFDSNILIRTVVHSGEKLYCWGGGGITHDSIAEEEYSESLTKVSNITGLTP